jgi:Transcription initiation factor TFIID, subunit TAF6 (also component of histone acetyltransferase SAGA)
MARARNIKPSFFQNDALGELPALARLLFIGMWTIADYRGCLEYRPKRIKAQILPYDDDANIEALVMNLEESGFVTIYSNAGATYLKIKNFEKHQNPHKNERDAGSDIPDVDDNGSEIIRLSKIEINREQNGTARADSPFPLPDSPFPLPDSGSPSGCAGAAPPTPDQGELVPADPKPKPATRRPAAKPSTAPTAAIWEAYARAYQDRYGVAPVRNAKVNGQLAHLLTRLGADEAPAVAAFFVRHNNRYYVQKAHSVDCLLADAEKLRTEWATGRRVTDASGQIPLSERNRAALQAHLASRKGPDPRWLDDNKTIDMEAL